MFDKIKSGYDQMQLMQKIMKDENFKAFISNPKVQTLFSDQDFQEGLKSQDSIKIMSHPKMLALKNDPEIAELIKKINFQEFFKK